MITNKQKLVYTNVAGGHVPPPIISCFTSPTASQLMLASQMRPAVSQNAHKISPSTTTLFPVGGIPNIVRSCDPAARTTARTLLPSTPTDNTVTHRRFKTASCLKYDKAPSSPTNAVGPVASDPFFADCGLGLSGRHRASWTTTFPVQNLSSVFTSTTGSCSDFSVLRSPTNPITNDT